MIEVAAGILIAGVILGMIVLGLTIALDQDNRNLGASGSGWWLASIGGLAFVAIIYIAA